MQVMLMVFAVVFGFLTGIIISLSIRKKVKTSHRVREKKNAESRFRKKKRLIFSRFTDNGSAYTDIVCDSEKLDESAYVEKRRKKQTKAYNYMGRRRSIENCKGK